MQVSALLVLSAALALVWGVIFAECNVEESPVYRIVRLNSGGEIIFDSKRWSLDSASTEQNLIFMRKDSQ